MTIFMGLAAWNKMDDDDDNVSIKHSAAGADKITYEMLRKLANRSAKTKSNAWRRYIVWDGCADMTRTSAGSDDDLSQSPEYCCTGSTQTHCRWDERWAEMTRNCDGVDDDLKIIIWVVFHLTSAETQSVSVKSTQWAFHITSAVQHRDGKTVLCRPTIQCIVR